MKSWRSSFTLPPERPIYEWLEENIVIPPNYPGNFSGPYRIALTPYLRGIYDAIQDPKIRTVTVMKGAQTGLSLLLQCYICYSVCEDPAPIAMFMPTGSLAFSLSETRLQVLMQHNAATREQIHPDPDRFKKMEYLLNRCVVTLSGANNATQTSSRSVRTVIVDESDKVPKEGRGEASPIKLAVERAKTFWNRKIIFASTPTTPDGFIHKSYQLGDQRQLFCSCHACGAEQVLSWQVVKFGEGGADPHYFCGTCGSRWSRLQTLSAIDRAIWRPTAEKITDPTHASFKLPSFYSRWVNIADVVTEFLSCKDNAFEMQNLINSTFAEPFEPRPAKSAESQAIFTFRDLFRYPRQTIPFSGKTFLVLCVDIQQAYCVWSVWAIGPRDHALVDHGNASTLEDVEELARKTYKAGEEVIPIKVVMMDTGFRTGEAYESCLRLQRSGIMSIPVKGNTGASTSQGEPVKVQRIGTYPDGRPLPASQQILLRHIHPRFFHDIAWDIMAPVVSTDGNDVVEIWKRRKVRLYLHQGIDRDFVNQITAEALVETKEDARGMTRLEVKRLRKSNHQFDCFRYSLVARHLMKADLEERPAQSLKPKTQAQTPMISLESVRL